MATVTQDNPKTSVGSTLRNSPLSPVKRVWHLAALKYGLSLADYCKRRLGRSKYHVSEVLAGRRESPGLLDAVAADLGVDVVDITNEKNPTGSLWSA